MSEEELREVIEKHRIAARNAIEAGFDGVEIQGGGGYLPDQSPQDLTNKGTDHWRHSVENRARFLLEVVKAIPCEIGPNRVSMRLSPWTYKDYKLAIALVATGQAALVCPSV